MIKKQGRRSLFLYLLASRLFYFPLNIFVKVSSSRACFELQQNNNEAIERENSILGVLNRK